MFINKKILSLVVFTITIILGITVIVASNLGKKGEIFDTINYDTPPDWAIESCKNNPNEWCCGGDDDDNGSPQPVCNEACTDTCTDGSTCHNGICKLPECIDNPACENLETITENLDDVWPWIVNGGIQIKGNWVIDSHDDMDRHGIVQREADGRYRYETGATYGYGTDRIEHEKSVIRWLAPFPGVVTWKNWGNVIEGSEGTKSVGRGQATSFTGPGGTRDGAGIAYTGLNPQITFQKADYCAVPPSPSPSPSPISSFQCTGLSPQSPMPTRGSSTTFTCAGTAENMTINTADFQVQHRTSGSANYSVLPEFTQNGVAVVNNQASYTLTLPESAGSGDYLVQCRLCASNSTCTSWGQTQ